ncbi:hypothetical protein H2199_007899 [Coniosporium tulheliwenetii]|uniref:Uncharacterized protein n=1 Tax=Coniosporium tulheliwenetii TaxID=3383036 RepID=A0ACC2YM96_9PEZI|nr:hypothetical protein H2199_007899 [Cladosporium sp. JES 115]
MQQQHLVRSHGARWDQDVVGSGKALDLNNVKNSGGVRAAAGFEEDLTAPLSGHDVKDTVYVEVGPGEERAVGEEKPVYHGARGVAGK